MNMIEKVARAIATEDCHNYSIPTYKILARIAIKAMRELTEEMIVDSIYQGCYDSVGLWRSMIDAALKE